MSRFRNAKAYAGYCGLVPRKSKSGKSDHQGLRITKASHRLLKKY
ncbi:MAG: transposase [Acidobacteria bacterium]|nr:transposase [Acidobacteriota bacterium]